MAGETTTLARDFADLLRAFIDHDVRFLVIGAYALAVHGRPRATGDLDLWVDATTENAARTMRTFNPFTTTPVEGVNYELGPSFGKALSADDYQAARSYFFSVGFRF